VAILDTNFSSIAGFDPTAKLIYAVSAVVSGIVVGVLSWLAVRALARAGALSRFAAGRRSVAAEAAERVEA
jgi:energy-coupling factor transport system substrate-specific component